MKIGDIASRLNRAQRSRLFSIIASIVVVALVGGLVGTYAVNFDANNVLWKRPLPGKGCSTPIVVQDVIYLTAPVLGSILAVVTFWLIRPRTNSDETIE